MLLAALIRRSARVTAECCVGSALSSSKFSIVVKVRASSRFLKLCNADKLGFSVGVDVRIVCMTQIEPRLVRLVWIVHHEACRP